MSPDYPISGNVEKVLEKLGLPVQIQEIPGASEWLFLNGFKDPIPTHDAFDFSAYKTTSGRKIMGIPATNVYAPFDGHVLRAYDDRECSWGVFGEPGYGGEVEIMGKIGDCIITAILAHITPHVQLGNVRKGELIGRTFCSPEKEEGTLGHLHYHIEIAYNGRKYSIDPLETLPQNTVLEKIQLPHKGPFTKEELGVVGLEIQFSKGLNYLQDPHGM